MPRVPLRRLLVAAAVALLASSSSCHAWRMDLENANANNHNNNDHSGSSNGNGNSHSNNNPHTNATSSPPSSSSSPPPSQVTGNEALTLAVGCASGVAYPGPEAARFTATVANPNAKFLTVHFTRFNLPPDDYLVVRATDPRDNETLVLKYYGREQSGAFFSKALYTTSITLELVTTGDPTGNNVFDCVGFAVDKYRFLAQPASGSTKEEVCGADDSQEAACLRGSPDVFKRADAVVRLLIHKGDSSFFCTGWLLGCEGHVITNNHCISTQDHASNTEFEFRAQGDTCATACNSPLGCKGAVRARSSQLVLASAELDYALVKLDINYSNDYGYLQMRESGAKLNERLYIPQHPGGWGKRIAMKDGDKWGSVESTTMGGCLNNQVAYSLDTQGGSSGSPVIAWDDNVVVALHHCGGCPNTGVNTNMIVADMRAKNILPKCAVPSATTPTTSPPPPTSAPTTTSPPPTSAPTTTRPPPTSAPTSPPPPSTKPSRATRVDGTITTTATVASVDYIDFTLAEAATVELDVLSMEAAGEESGDARFVDVNGDCNAAYIDSSIALFQVNADGSIAESTVIAVNDNAPAGYGAADGSISLADSYILRPLAAGRYRVAVGVASMTIAQAVAKAMPVAASPRVCDARISNYGSYRLTLTTTSDVTVSGPGSYIGSQCRGENTLAPYGKCAYHKEAPQSTVVAVDGTIVRQGSASVSVDYIPFTVPTFGRVTLDVSSFENNDGTKFVDVNGFCTSSYIDAVAFLFRRPVNPGAALSVADVVNAGDDDDNFALRRRVGVSFRDPFLSLALPAGGYVLAVGRYPMTVQAAIAKINTGSPDRFTPESCGAPSAQGNYRVTISSARNLSPESPNSFTGGKCPANVGKTLC